MTHCYKLCGYNIVLDVASGSIHSVDEVAFDVIRLYDTINDCEKQEQQKQEQQDMLINKVALKHPNVTNNDIREVIYEIETLKNRGKLFSPDIFNDITNKKSYIPLSALCMNVSHICNMSCSYCFAGHGMHNNETLMSLETATRAIDFLVEQSADRKNLDVDFFGGEPLLNLGVIKDTVAYARKTEHKNNKKFRFTLTTNGLLIDDDVIDFANTEMHNVVLSLDGRPNINDAMRKLPGSVGSYSDITPKITKLVDARHGKGYYIRGTFTRKNIDFKNDILHIADLGFKELAMEPVVTKPGDPLGFTTDDLPELFSQYETLAAKMLQREKTGNGFNFYHYTLDLSNGPCVHKRIAGCGVGTEYLAVTPSGEIYPCHQFIGDKKFMIGDVWRGILNNELCNEFSNTNIYTRSQCRDCWAKFYCSGGCAANAYNYSGSIDGSYELGCELLKKRIECAIMMYAAKTVH
ncbi:MAG: thioether cross-link-forming SCIFF peptide maturase [Oscillospiraceae bacterium]|jgi:uncharacterized protein|nr:thioether cross-link-forming SCIFF peptide maturase [Oscillospiraceae bacterium]